MSTEIYKACIKVAACICARDGVISVAEEAKMFKLLAERFPDVDEAMFEEALNEFFNSNDQIEKYLTAIDDEQLRKFALRLSEQSASADGLETRENIALNKAYLIWGVES